MAEENDQSSFKANDGLLLSNLKFNKHYDKNQQQQLILNSPITIVSNHQANDRRGKTRQYQKLSFRNAGYSSKLSHRLGNDHQTKEAMELEPTHL